MDSSITSPGSRRKHDRRLESDGEVPPSTPLQTAKQKFKRACRKILVVQKTSPWDWEDVKAFLSAPEQIRTYFHYEKFHQWILRDQNFPFFHTMTPDRVKSVLPHMQVEIHAAKTTLFKQFDMGDKFYTLVKGKCSVWIAFSTKESSRNVPIDPDPNRCSVCHEYGHQGPECPNSFDKEVKRFGDGTSFGELALMSADSKRTAGIQCVTACEFLVVDGRHYEETLRQANKELYDRICHFMHSIKIFSRWSREKTLKMAHSCQEHTYPPNYVFCRGGEPADAIYFIIAGEADVYWVDSDYGDPYNPTKNGKTHQADDQPRKLVDLQDTDFVVEKLKKQEQRYYRVKFFHPGHALRIQLRCISSGDVDAFVCNKRKKPSMDNHTWVLKAARGEGNHITIGPEDPNFQLGGYVLCIHGYSDAEFELKISTVKVDDAMYRARSKLDKSKARLVASLGPKCWFGDESAIKNIPHPVTIVSRTECRCYRIDVQDFLFQVRGETLKEMTRLIMQQRKLRKQYIEDQSQLESQIGDFRKGKTTKPMLVATRLHLTHEYVSPFALP